MTGASMTSGSLRRVTPPWTGSAESATTAMPTYVMIAAPEPMATRRLSPWREMATSPRVLLAAQPTRGVDIGAIEFIHRRLVTERDGGAGILLVSAELDEIRSLSDRIAVMYEGRIVSTEPADASEERLGLLMTGGGAGDRLKAS